MSRKPKTFRLFSFLPLMLLVGFGLALSGCTPEDNSANQPPKQTQPAKPNYVEKIEFRPDTSNEFQRVHRYLPNGTKVGMRIDYRDGTSKMEHYRRDGSIHKVEEFHKVVDKLKSVTEFDLDGKPTGKTTYRISGRLESKIEYVADGTEKITTYRIDGKRLHSVTIDRKDGTKSTTYYRRDGKSLWAKAEWHNSRTVTVDYFDDQGKLSQRIEKSSNSKNVTVFDGNGKAVYKQYWDGYWNPTSTYYYYNSYQLETVEEFESDGSTVKRRIHVERYSDRVSKLEYFKDGELVKEQELNGDGTVKEEKILQDDGTWQTETVPPIEDVHPDPPVDTKRFDELDWEDPLTNSPNNFL